MACVTLKRPLDFDPLESLHSPDRPQTKRRRCTPIKGLDRDDSGGRLSLPNPPETSGLPSAFLESVLSAEEIASNLRDELKRLKHRRQLATQDSMSARQGSPSSPEPMSQEAGEARAHGAGSFASSSASSGPSPSSPLKMSSPSSSGKGFPVSYSCSLQAQQQSSSALPSTSTSTLTVKGAPPSVRSWMGTRDKPVFTLKQMTLICERMCKERTEQVRQEYDRILQQKLCEQYDAFVKFIDQQIQERFHRGRLPSYLS